MYYDIIGDIHGYVVPLTELLGKLGYYHKNGYYQHPEGRKVIFVGDFIDRGANIRETLQLVKAMIDNKTGAAVMGNHEYNAICFHEKDKINGSYLRKHKFKNITQHYETIRQFAHHEKEWRTWIEWFLQLPLFIEKQDFRVVHACWDDNFIAHIKKIAPNYILPLDVIHNAQERGTKNYEAIEGILKGKETTLPDGLFFDDKDGHRRTEVRTKWWLNANGLEYNEYFMSETPELVGKKIKDGEIADNNFYSEKDVPVFFGHYWLKGESVLQKHNAVCVDYSVAKGGKLVAYRWNGEKELTPKSLIY